ncbi:nuclear transport factor 2 family protein [bacterium]|nr:nuclear transport factor 2 family protein [bacterium]
MSSAELAFAEQFAAAWAAPTAERLVALLTDDVVLYQPHRPPLRGRPAALAEFQRLFRWLPALRGEVHRAGGGDGVVFVEWTMRFPLGGSVVRIPAVDRFLLRDGLGAERTVYFDQLPLIAGVLRHPSAWPGYVRYRFR